MLLRKGNSVATFLATSLLLLCMTQNEALASPGGFIPTGTMKLQRELHTATLLNDGMVLIAGGENNSGALSTAELYNPTTGTFALTGSMHYTHIGNTATLLNNGMVLIAGGNASSAELYNPTTGTFTATGSMNTTRYYHTATLLNNGMVLIAGGVNFNSGVYLSSAELYNPATGTFTFTGNLNNGRFWHTATSLNNGVVLIVGGTIAEGITGLSTAELYNAVTGAFTFTGSLSFPRQRHAANLLNSGMVLIAGGTEGGTLAGPISTVVLYNPASGIFGPTGSLNDGRYLHTQTILSNGEVLVAGGVAFGPPMATAELYDPVASSFTLTGTLNAPRALQTATLLNNGMVLVAGGYTNSTTVLASAELYQPSTLTPPGLISISLSPANPWVPLGGFENLAAIGTFTGNVTETLTSANWTSTNTPVVTVTNDWSNYGHAIAVSDGIATVTACAGSVCGSTMVNVAPHTNVILGSASAPGTFETYDDSGDFLSSGNLNVAVSLHSATLLNNGTIFVAGGQNARGSWEIVNIKGQTLSSGSLLNAFYSHLAVRLANGNVFLAGGTASPGAWEIHGPSGALVSSGTLLGKRTPGAGAVALQDGNIWISGSGAGQRSDECSWEIHDINGNLLSNGTLTTCFASGKLFVLSNGDVVLIGGFNAPSTYEIHTQTGAFVRSGNLTNGFDASSGAVLVNNNIFLFELGFWEFVGFDANANKTFDTTGTLLDARTAAKGVVTSTGKIFITGGSGASGSWEMWTPSGTTATLFKFGTLLDARDVGHTDTHF